MPKGLGSEVVECACERSIAREHRTAALSNAHCRAEIGDLHVHGGEDQEVGGLHVEMHNITNLVHPLQRGDGLLEGVK